MGAEGEHEDCRSWVGQRGRPLPHGLALSSVEALKQPTSRKKSNVPTRPAADQ